MNNSLAYTTSTQSGRRLRFSLPLHEKTRSEDEVAALLTAVLDALDARIRGSDDPPSDGDVLQSLAMALAIRTRLTEEPGGPVHELARHLLKRQLEAPSQDD